MNNPRSFNNAANETNYASKNMLIEDPKDNNIKGNSLENFNVFDDKENLHPNINVSKNSNSNFDYFGERSQNLLQNVSGCNNELIEEHSSITQFDEGSVAEYSNYFTSQHIIDTPNKKMSNVVCESSQYLLLTNTDNEDCESIYSNLTVANCMNKHSNNESSNENAFLNSNEEILLQTSKSMPTFESDIRDKQDSLANFSCS